MFKATINGFKRYKRFERKGDSFFLQVVRKAKKQPGFVQILVLLLFLFGLSAGVYLIQNKTSFLPKANNLQPNLSQTSSLPLGIHLVQDVDINSFWNSHAHSTDVSTGWPANINLVASSTAGVKVLTYGEGADPEATMNSAVSAGIKMVMANFEQTTDINALLAKEASDYQLAKSKGLTFIFAPMGTTLKQYYSYNDYALLKNADIIFYQTQIMQDNATLLGTTDPSVQIIQYAAIIKDLIHQMRPYVPQRKVWVQVSVNPPQNRNITADRVIQYIDSITDGSADSPDEIQIFYKYTDYPEQIPVLKQVVEHYRPAPTPTPILSKQDHEKKGKKLSVTVDARFYPDVKSQLKAGDFLAMPAVRQLADTPMTADNWKFKQAVAALNSVDENEIGVQKGILLSAVADVQNLINNIPPDVNWISYNMEPGMTPSSDLQDPVNSVRQFATVVHNSDRKFGFAPTRVIFDQYQGSQTLKDALLISDMALYQGQLLLPTMSEEEFIKTVKEKYNYVKSINPNTEFRLQLWLGRQTPDQMAKVFNRSVNYMDKAGIGTHSDLEGILQVLPQLKWR
ncbi:MAG: hypothetical protein Q7S03_01290 [bacterium]|nr:hypothetical protein [bacterium]